MTAILCASVGDLSYDSLDYNSIFAIATPAILHHL
jgi:hypothetical protein